MTKFTKTTTLLSTLLVLGCGVTDSGDENKNSDNNGSNNGTTQGEKVEKVEIADGVGTIATISDTALYKFTAEAGKSYSVEVSDTSEDYWTHIVDIVDADGVSLLFDNNYTSSSRAFIPSISGEHTIKIAISLSNNDSELSNYPYTIEVTEVETPAGLDGKWLLVKETGSAFDKSYERTYSANSVDDLLEFNGDVLIRYTYDTYSDTVRSELQLFAESWKSEMKFQLSGNNLTLSQGNKDGSYYEYYVKYTGDISALTWKNENYSVPAELIGTWYNSAEEYRWEEFGNGEFESEILNEQYTQDETSYIYRITADTVYSYSRNGFSYNMSATAVEHSWIYRVVVNGNTFTDTWAGIEMDGDDDYEVGYEVETYAKYTGELPPAKWSEVTLPTSSTDIVEGVKFSRDNISDGDVTWLKISLISGVQYLFEANSDNCCMDFFLIDTEPKQIRQVGGYSSFTPEETGDFYIYCVNEDIHDGSTYGFEITVTANSNEYTTMTSRSVSAEQRKCTDFQGNCSRRIR